MNTAVRVAHVESDILLDISVYGNYLPEHQIFGTGFTYLALEMAIMICARISLIKTLARASGGSIPVSLCCTGVSGLFACGFLIPMGWIGCFTSNVHFMSAIMVFVSIAVAECSDTASFYAVTTKWSRHSYLGIGCFGKWSAPALGGDAGKGSAPIMGGLSPTAFS